MAEIELRQQEADYLIAMEKHRVNDALWAFPRAGERVAIPVVSADGREPFMLDVTRSTVKLTKATFQNRVRQVIVLLRLDLYGAPHRNPDGEEIACPHLHVYREGHGDKWAFPVVAELTGATGLYPAFASFMQRCNVTSPPVIQGEFF